MGGSNYIQVILIVPSRTASQWYQFTDVYNDMLNQLNNIETLPDGLCKKKKKFWVKMHF